MSVKLISGVAASLGMMAILACMLIAPSILNEIHNIRSELSDEALMFKLQSDELWNDMRKLGASTHRVRRQNYDQPSSGSSNTEPYDIPIENSDSKGKNNATSPIDTDNDKSNFVGSATQTQNKCNCGAQPPRENKCPPGQPGPKGLPGDNGFDGEEGADGLHGNDADDAQMQMQPLDKCFHCPIGAPGPQGPPGRSGPRGMRGAKGQPGVPGRDGQPGFPGGLGPQGKQGPQGAPGVIGVQGDDARIIHGRIGLKGEQGPIGPAGDVGPPGADGGMGQQGPEGDPGASGADGKNGEDGDVGEPGDEGEPGVDAEYCPCPSRTTSIENDLLPGNASDAALAGSPPSTKSSQQPAALPPALSNPYRRRRLFTKH